MINPYLEETETEQNPYLSDFEEPTLPEVKLSAYDLAKDPPVPKGVPVTKEGDWDFETLARIQLQTPEPMGTWGPLNPMEVVTGPNLVNLGRNINAAIPPALSWTAGAIKEGVESGMGVVEDLASAMGQSWGLRTYPGVPMVPMENYPITAGGPVGWGLRIAAPEFAQGIDEATGELLSGFTTPGQAAMIPFAALKPVQAAFLASTVVGIPETAMEVLEAEDQRQFGRAMGRLGGQLGISALLTKSLTRKGGRYAPEEGKESESRVSEHPQAAERGVSSEAGGGYSTLAETPLAQEAQVLLTKAGERNREAGLGQEVITVESFADDPGNLKVFKAEPAVVDEAGNFVRPGRIQMSRKAFDAWWKETAPDVRENALMSLFAEEGIHSITTPAEAAAFLNTLTRAEKAIGRRNYLGKLSPESIGLTDTGLGFELLRQRLQQLMEMSTTELAEATGIRRWSVKSMEFLSNLITRMREWIGTEASTAGAGITKGLLDRAQKNLDELKKIKAEEPAPERGSRAELDAFEEARVMIETGDYNRSALDTVLAQLSPESEGRLIELAQKYQALEEPNPAADYVIRRNERAKTAGEDFGFETGAEGEPMATGDQPFGIRRTYQPEEISDRISRVSLMTPDDFQKDISSTEGGLTGDAWNLGLSLTDPEQLKLLDRQIAKDRAAITASLKKKDFQQAAFHAFRGQYWREAKEAATGTGSAALALSKEMPGYQPPLPEGKIAEAPAGVRRMAEPAQTVEQFRESIRGARTISTRQAIAALGDRPEYLDDVVSFIVNQREKLNKGMMTVRDAAKSYLATVGSIQAGEVSVAKVAEKVPGIDKAPEFWSYSKTGEPRVRPEDAIAYWFTTPEGKTALDNLEAGRSTPADWNGLFEARKAFGYDTDLRRTASALPPKSKSAYNLTNLKGFVDELNAARGNPDAVMAAVQKLQGVGEGKRGFIGQFLGVGEVPTVDAVEINFWLTGKGNARQVSDSARAKVINDWKKAGGVGLGEEVSKRIEARVKDLQNAGIAADVPPEALGAVIHHWIWDRAKGTKTPHEGLYRAIELAGVRRRGSREAPGQSELFLPPAGAAQLAAKAETPREISLPRAGQPELPLEAKGPVAPSERVGMEVAAPGTLLTASKSLETVDSYLSGTQRPRFSEFVDEFSKTWGFVRPGQVLDAWQEGVWKSLLTQPGQKLSELRDSLGLGRFLGEREVRDPIEAVTPEGERLLPGMAGFEKVTKLDPTVRAEQNYRLHVISRIGESLIEEGRQRGQSLEKKALEPQDLGHWRKSVEGTVREIESQELKNTERLGEILTEGGAVDRTTLKKRVRNGLLVTVKEKVQPETVTKRVTALVDRKTGRVELVSTYRKSRGGAYLVDPERTQFKRPNVPLAEVLVRYRPIASFLLDEPVQNFHQRFPNIKAFQREMLNPAKADAAKYASSLSVLEESGYTGEVLGPSKKTTGQLATPGEIIHAPGALEKAKVAPITRTESYNLLETIFDELPRIEGPEDIRAVIDSLAIKSESGMLKASDRSAIAALQKGYDVLKERWDVLEPEQVFDQLVDEIYDHATKAESNQDFANRLAESYGAEGAQDVRPVPTGEAPAVERTKTLRELSREPTSREAALAESKTATELQTLRSYGPWVDRAQPVRRGPGAPITQGVPEPPQTVTKLRPEDRAYISALIKQEKIKAKAEKRTRPVPALKTTGLPTPTTPRPISPGELLGIRRLAQQNASAFTKSIIDVGRAYSEWMVDTMQRVGGPKSKAFAFAVGQMISDARGYYGGLTPLLDPARRAAGGLNLGTLWLHRLNRVTNDAAISNMVGALEGTRQVPRYAQRIVDLADRANRAIGALGFSAAGHGVATGKVQRNLTGYGVDIIRQGQGDAFKSLVRGNAIANNLPITDVRDFFLKMKEQLDKPGISMAEIEKINQDFERVMPKAITHIKVAGKWQPIIHADLFSYLERAAQRAANVKAFRDVFPNTPAGNRAFTKLITEVKAEQPGSYYVDNVDALMRALQGHPTDTYSRMMAFAPGTPIADGFRFLNQTVGNFFAKSVLTGQIPVQSGEVIAGAAPMFFGYRNYLKGMARVRQLYPQLELNGAVNRVMLDWSMDPHSAVRSAFRIAGNTISKVFAEHAANEFQEASAAATAAVVGERIRANTLTVWEKAMLPETFKTMGFTRNEVQLLMSGDLDMLARFERRAASFLTSGNKAIAEGSRIGANRLVNSIFRFQAYPMMKTNQLLKVFGNAIDAWKSGTKTEKFAASYLAGRFLFGAGAQGAITAGIVALFFEGLGGLKIRKEEAKDEPFRFFIESMLASMSGPLYLMWRGATDKGIKGVEEKVVKSVFPYSILREMTDFATSSGSYKDLDDWDKTAKFIRMKMPGTRTISLGMAMSQLSKRNPELDAAISAFYRWQRKELGTAGTPPEIKTDTGKPFRIQMGKAMRALRDGDEKALDNALDAAEDLAEKRGQVKSSIRSRKILKGPGGRELTDEEMDALRRRIGGRALSVIEAYDDMVEAVSR